MLNKNIALKIENISKIYRIGTKEDISDNMTSTIVNFFKSPIANYRKYRSLYRFDDIDLFNENQYGDIPPDIIWALKDVSFEVEQGEVVGIIGPNGAGKSTLLKILCRITNPTRGYAEIYGRVASLLEVGTGFHQELTGRENVYLNGAILGMTKREIDNSFDEIVDFSGIEMFIDTPVKRYSSGMRVRLAFSVAAHLRPEVLIIDEVLAVGDEQFQKKCLSKMEDAARKGRTVIFVSHNMTAVLRLCKRVVLLDHGTVTLDGPALKTVSEYIKTGTDSSAERLWPDIEKAPGNDNVRLRAVRVCDEDGMVDEAFDIRKSIYLEVEYEVLRPGNILSTHFHLENAQSVRVFSVHDTDIEWMNRPRKVGRYRCRAKVPGNFLSDGLLYVHVVILTMAPIETQCWVPEAVSFNVVDSFGKNTARGDWPNEMYGAVRPLLQWTTDFSLS